MHNAGVTLLWSNLKDWEALLKKIWASAILLCKNPHKACIVSLHIAFEQLLSFLLQRCPCMSWFLFFSFPACSHSFSGHR